MKTLSKTVFYSAILSSGLIFDVGVIDTYRSVELARLSNLTDHTTQLLENEYNEITLNQNHKTQSTNSRQH